MACLTTSARSRSAGCVKLRTPVMHSSASGSRSMPACRVPSCGPLQTAQHACAPLGVEVTLEPRLAGEPFDPLDLAAGLGEVLLVGHDPAFTLTLHDLTGAQARMRKGGLAAINKGELITLLRPNELAAIAAGAGVT